MYKALKTIENRGSENKGAYQPASKIKKMDFCSGVCI